MRSVFLEHVHVNTGESPGGAELIGTSDAIHSLFRSLPLHPGVYF